MLKIFVLAALISTTVNVGVKDFTQNISGAWESDRSGLWVIAQDGSQASFTQAVYNENFGDMVYSFKGKIFEGDLLDSFCFEGETDGMLFEVGNGEQCVLDMKLSTKGHLVGKVSDRVIFMDRCLVTVVVRCLSGGYSSSYVDCSGVWK